MKRIFLLPLVCFAAPLLAQQTSGVIVYQEVLTIDMAGRDLPEGVVAMIPKEHKTEKVLYFSSEATLYENSDKEDDNKKEEYKQDNIMIRTERNVPDDKIFMDLKNKKVVAQKDLMGRIFLVSDSAGQEKWKFTGRQKKILDLPCLEAVSVTEKDSIVAWYTTAIPVQSGPAGLCGLPGMMLEAHMGSAMHLVAVRIGTAQEATQKIRQPSKGKKISAAAFDKLQQEKEQELQKQYGGSGNGKVIIMNSITR